MIPLRPRYTKIDKLVDSLLQQSRIRKPPVDVSKIAEAQGAEISYETFGDDVSGVLIRQKTRNVIGVQRNQSTVRQRFTIAHELGHLLLHEGEELHVDKSFAVNWRRSRNDEGESEPNIMEIEANAFAASLLMPKDMIEAAHGSRVFDLEDEGEVDRLATLFHVSRQAMSFRLFNLFGRPSY